MSTNPLPSPGRPTFGVEIEFLIATLFMGTEDPDEGVKDLPPVLRIPNEALGDRYGYVNRLVKEVLDEFLPPKSPLTTVGNESMRSILQQYNEWTVDHDASVGQVGNSLYQIVGVEVKTPVQFSSPNSFKAVSLGISAITSRFRCTVNIRCGLHVHVGAVSELLPLEQMRRLASLVYATEPLLYSLHDPIRRGNYYCRPLQDFATIGSPDGEGVVELVEHIQNKEDKWLCSNYIGTDRRHGEEPLSAREQYRDDSHIEVFLATRQSGHFEPFTTRGKSSRDINILPEVHSEVNPRVSAAQLSSLQPPVEQARQRNIPRMRIPRFSTEDHRTRYEMSQRSGCAIPRHELKDLLRRGPATSVFKAVYRIYSQPATCHISELLSASERPGINILGHGCYWVGDTPSRRTIEFRLGEGSLDGEWIATWAKICVGIFKFALYSSACQFIDVLTKCDQAMKEDGSYDIVDLLDDIGLFAEAEIVERRLMANRYRWNLSFDESEYELLFAAALS
ncbi:hypothetical protein RRF57_009830 [Xylaria bambusicola]|uniref:Uncharacterized protein n=1 Tax=Xylaria bambusicola TaxID=326684 RepID=A0AAN7ZCA6_9PEZI